MSRVVAFPAPVCAPVTVRVPVSYGELLDKISILEIKREAARDRAMRAHIEAELAALREARDAALRVGGHAEALCRRLKDVNARLFRIEDALRDCEREGAFGEAFVGLARSVYRLNDLRARIKRKLNDHLGSPLVEEKLYRRY